LSQNRHDLPDFAGCLASGQNPGAQIVHVILISLIGSSLQPILQNPFFVACGTKYFLSPEEFVDNRLKVCFIVIWVFRNH
jgi:hypothetical protein